MQGEIFEVVHPNGLSSIEIRGNSVDSSFEVARIESLGEYPVSFDTVGGRIVIDVGAGYGEFSARAILNGAKTVVCLEPNPLVFPWLEMNLGQQGNVVMFEAGLWSCSMETTLFVRETGSASGSINEVQYDPTHPTALDRIQIPIKLVGFDFLTPILSSTDDEIVLKIDAEGCEYEIMSNLPSASWSDQISTIWLEYHKGIANLGEILNEMGFTFSKQHKYAEMGLIEATR